MRQTFGKKGRNRRAAAALQHVDVFVLHDQIQQIRAQIVAAGEEGGGKVAVGVDAGCCVGSVGVEQNLKPGNDGIGKNVAENDETGELNAEKRQGMHERITFEKFSASIGQAKAACKSVPFPCRAFFAACMFGTVMRSGVDGALARNRLLWHKRNGTMFCRGEER